MVEWNAEVKAAIFRSVKGVLVRHSADLGLISVQVTKSSVMVRGSLRKGPGASSEFTPDSLDLIQNEMEGVKHVPRIDLDFDNWRRADAGKWKNVK